MRPWWSWEVNPAYFEASKQLLSFKADHALTILIHGSPQLHLHQCHPQPPVPSVPTGTYPSAIGGVDTKLKRTLCWNPPDHRQSWTLHAYGWLRERSCSRLYCLHAHYINITQWAFSPTKHMDKESGENIACNALKLILHGADGP